MNFTQHNHNAGDVTNTSPAAVSAAWDRALDLAAKLVLARKSGTTVGWYLAELDAIARDIRALRTTDQP